MNSFAEMLGISTSDNKTCFLGTTDEGMAVLVNGKDYFLRYADFPWFEYCCATELRVLVHAASRCEIQRLQARSGILLRV